MKANASTISGAGEGAAGTVIALDASKCVVDGFRISGGGTARGVFVQGSFVEFNNCIVEKSTAANSAGVYVQSGSVAFENCTIKENSASNYGGGICVGAGTANIDFCTICENSASAGSGVDVLTSAALGATNSII